MILCLVLTSSLRHAGMSGNTCQIGAADMYSISRDTYTCDECGFEEKWDTHDDHRGDIWECEYCGKHFCTFCFMSVADQEVFDRMLHGTDRVVCAKHYLEITGAKVV